MSDDIVGRLMQLNSSMETLAAVGAALRVEAEGLTVEPEIAALLDKVRSAADIPRDLPAAQRDVIIGFVRAFFAQATDLLDHPDRRPGWHWIDSIVLQAQGRGSAIIADVIAEAAPKLDNLEQRLQRGARCLDVGTGTGWFAIALARRYPTLAVVGLDRHEPALALARANVTGAGLGARVSIIAGDIVGFEPASGFDLVWLPGPFLEAQVMPSAIATARRALVPGGWLIVGLYAGAGDPVSDALAALRSVRSGGHDWSVSDIVEAISRSGFDRCCEIERTWRAPMRLFAGQAPTN